MLRKKVTMQDVAQRADVSIGTVSAVINEKPTVSKHTRYKVLQAVGELDYRPNATARRSRHVGEKSIGLIVTEVHDPSYADLILGVKQKAASAGYQVLVASSERTSAQERQIIKVLIEKEVDGMIISPLLDEEADQSHLFETKLRNIPLVMLGSLLGLQTSVIEVDRAAASRNAVQYLIDRGHTRIIHFAGFRHSMHTNKYIKGVQQAFSSRPLGFSDDNIVHAGTRFEDGYRAGLAYFGDRAENRPTAVTCYNDQLAIGLIRALRELTLDVPGDVSVVGYDDIELASYASPPLTTVHVPTREVGQQAVEMLIRHIETADTSPATKVRLQAEMVERKSTRALQPHEAEPSRL